MKELLNRYNKVIIGVLVVLLIFVSKLYKDRFLLSDENDKIQIEEEIQLEGEDKKALTIEESKDSEIYVHVCGEVKEPGLVKLKEGSRVIDAINSAGGMYENADLDSINLAKKLEDEDKIYVPKIGEVENNDFSNVSENKKININEASIDELTKLSGVGEKTAKKIIEYRKKKNFKKIEDILEVPGFGEKKFQEIEEYIKVN